jgi:hypothetical protein
MTKAANLSALGSNVTTTGNLSSESTLTLQTNSTTAITVDSSQRAAFVAGTAALPAITTAGDTNTGVFFPAADTIAFAEGGTETMRLTSTGAVSFGSSGTAYGTSGQYLQSNGNTTPTWTTVTQTTFQTSLSGLTPSTASSGAVTLAGTLGITSGGTGNTTGNAVTATAAAGSAFSTAQTASEGQLIARFTGQNDAYLFNNATVWGVYSASGGTAFTYTRSTGLFAFNGTANSAPASSINTDGATYLVGNVTGSYLLTNFNRTPTQLGYAGTWTQYNQTSSPGQNTLYGWIRRS